LRVEPFIIARRYTYVAGAGYSIADVATWPWVNAFGFIGLDLAATPAVQRWHAAIDGRPAVQRGLAVAPPPARS